MAALNLGQVLLEREFTYLSWLASPAQAVRRQRNRGLVQAMDGELKESLTALRALAVRPEAAWWDKHNLGVALLLLGEAPQSIRWLRRAVLEGGENDRALFALALAHILTGERSEAEALLGRAGIGDVQRLMLLKNALATGALDDLKSGSPAADTTHNPNSTLERLLAFAQVSGVSLKITYLAVQTGLTGGVKILLEQANWLKRRGHRVKVLSYNPRPEWLPLEVDFEQVPLDQLLSESASGADLVVGTFWTQNHDLGRAVGATRVFLAQGDEYVWAPSAMDPKLHQGATMAHQVPARILTVSDGLASQLKQVYGRPSRVVDNGLDLTLFKPQPKSTAGILKVMAVGRDSLAFKGLQDVFEAVRIARSRGVNCELVWVSPDEPASPHDDCTFYKAPSQPDLARLYAEADVFVSGSHFESFSLPCLEAMACGTAVVSADNAGVRTYARPGENCLLIPPGDPAAMAEAIIRLAADPGLRGRLAQAGVETASWYNWLDVAARLESTLFRTWIEDLFVVDDGQSFGQETISLCIIARDEEAVIARCLASARDQVDDIIVVDTGSTDRTRETAAEFGARVFDVPWRNDFSYARNQALDRARGDWILWLDADEELSVGPDALRKAVRANRGAEALFLSVESLMDDFDSNSRIVHASPRLFRNRPHHRFEGAIHEQIQAPIERGGGRILTSALSVLHYGYLPSVREAKHKGERNTALLQEQIARDGGDSFAHFNLATEYFVQGDYATAQAEYLKAYQTAPPAAPTAQYFSKLLRNLATCHRLLSDLPAANEVLDEALALYPDYTDLWSEKGQVHEAAEEWGQAISAYDRCLQIGEAHPRYLSVEGTGTWNAWYRKGRVWERRGRLAEAVGAYAEAIRLRPGFREPALRAAFLVAQPDLDEDVSIAVDEALEPSELRDELLAQAHFRAGRFLRAGNYAARLPAGGLAAVVRAAGLLAGGDPAAARTTLSAAQIPPSEETEALKILVACAWVESNWEEANRLCAQMSQRRHETGPALQFISRVLQGSPVPASESSSALSDWAQVEGVLALLIDLGLYQLFERILPAFGDGRPPGWQGRVGKLLHRKGFSDLAFEFLAADRDLVPHDEEALRILGDLALDKGYALEAEALFRQAMALSSQAQAYLPRLAAAMLKAGKASEAAEILAQLATTEEMKHE